MRAAEFWRAVVADESGALTKLLETLAASGIRFCVIGGQGVNAYVEPLMSLDLALVVASNQVEDAIDALAPDFHVERFAHSINLSRPGSDLQIQIQRDPRFAGFVDRARTMPVLGIEMPVAHLEDLLRAKVWASGDAARRPSKRRKDLLDIERILEAFPALRTEVPQEILDRIS